MEREQTPKDKDGNYDFECIEALDTKLLGKDVKDLLDGKEVMLPRFNFYTGKKEPSGRKVKLNEKDPIKQYENFLLIDSLMDDWLEESDTFLVDLYSQLMNDFDYFKIKMNEIYGYVEKIYPNNITDVKKRVVKYLNQFNNFNISNISKQISMILEFEYLNNECDNFLEECNITVERPIYDKYGYQGLNYN